MRIIGFNSSGGLKNNADAALKSLAGLLTSVDEQYYLLAWCETGVTDSLQDERLQAIISKLVEYGVDRSRIVLSGVDFNLECDTTTNNRSLQIRIVEEVKEPQEKITETDTSTDAVESEAEPAP